ncbi:hypothetical protein B7P43_G17705 [Cryptotermes secundus]|uniref:DUF4371 domain-containing protein n=1 Tax=Cryptotermes secundus TaxID=105785 RepID=A0A2J7Q9F0_9NEOP|nr:hypothetical protein B7P43_G17705 [Cryptotermes secundus]
MLARYDSDLHNHLESSTAFRGSSPDIQNELIHSVSELMTMEIKKEISKANYVSLILDETSDVMNKCQLASVLRYVTADGNVEERFLRFTDVSSDRSANSLFNHALEILNDFECGPKLIAQTYDGAAVMASQHAGVQAKIREQYPNAIFVHCYAHRLNLVLAQSASFIKEVKVFFATLSGFRTFFAKSTKRTEALDSHLRKRFPSIAPTRWQYHSRLAETVHEYREGIENLLVSIIEEPEEWDVETISSARGLLSLLRDFDFNFMLKIFSSIFPYSGALFKILQTKRSDIAFCNTKIDEFKHHMQRLRGGFDHLWSEMENVFDSNGPTRPKRIRIDSMSGEERKNSYKRLFCEIIDVVCQNVSVRFSENATLLFLSLLDARYFPMYRTSFPEKAFSCLKENYGAFFDFVALKSELLVMFSDPDMAKDKTPGSIPSVRTSSPINSTIEPQKQVSASVKSVEKHIHGLNHVSFLAPVGCLARWNAVVPGGIEFCIFLRPLTVALSPQLTVGGRTGKLEAKAVRRECWPFGALSQFEQRANIKFLFKLGKSASETQLTMQQVYGDTILKKSAVYDWVSRFKNGQETLEDDQSR